MFSLVEDSLPLVVAGHWGKFWGAKACVEAKRAASAKSRMLNLDAILIYIIVQ